MKYNKVVMHNDVAQIEITPFASVACHPRTHAEALELVNLWNLRVAEDTIRQGLSTAPCFYFI